MIEKKVLNYFPKTMRQNVIYATAEDCGSGYKFYNITYILGEKQIHFTADGSYELKWEIKKLQEGNLKHLIDAEIIE